MSDFAEVARQVKRNNAQRTQDEYERLCKARDSRLLAIARLMKEADERGEASVAVDLDMIKDEQDIGFMNIHVKVEERRSADGRLIGYKIKW